MGLELDIMENLTDKDIEKLYKKAKIIAWNYYQNHYGTYLDIEDLVQEAVIGHLQGRPMRIAVIDAFRKAAPLSRSQVNKIPIPIRVEYNDVGDTNLQDLDTTVLISQLREAISNFDKRTQEIMSRRFFRDETLQKIGDDLNLSQERVRQIIKGAVLKLRFRFSDGSDSRNEKKREL